MHGGDLNKMKILKRNVMYGNDAEIRNEYTSKSTHHQREQVPAGRVWKPDQKQSSIDLSGEVTWERYFQRSQPHVSYELVAVVSHHGESFETGHYSAFVRYHSPNPMQQIHTCGMNAMIRKWRKCSKRLFSRMVRDIFSSTLDGRISSDVRFSEWFALLETPVSNQLYSQPARCFALRHASRRACARK